MGMKLNVNVGGCMGNARCAAVAPELFQLNDEGYVTTPEVDVPDGLEEQAQHAIESCPEQVISVARDRAASQ